ncbi:aminotransferase class V-fold PLP-dependent enzyme [bacterium]|nr:aminotransferase class V-fold PLP-dependent enzyme [bacterium]
MSPDRLYADYNATAPLRPSALEAMRAVWTAPGNPSSVHAEGRAARGVLERSRDVMAQALGAPARNIVFTSGATEAIQLAIEAALETEPDLVVLSAAEHDAARAFLMSRRPDAAVLPLLATGTPDLGALSRLIAGAVRPFVIAQAASNETGVISPLAEIAAMVHAAGGRLLVDAVQVCGRVDPPHYIARADWTVLSSHKIGGPAGAGALILHAGAGSSTARPGGGQEQGRRAGTENVAAIAGFAAALVEAHQDVAGFQARVGAERDSFEEIVRESLPDAHVFGGDGVPRLANTSCIALPGWRGETAVIGLDLEGLAVSSGAACSSGKVARSRTLAAMLEAMPERDPSLADHAIRVSFGWATRSGDGARAAAAYIRTAGRVRARRTTT